MFYIEFEENFGLISHVYELFERAIFNDAKEEDTLELINLYLAKAS
jgi:hypothetical protein